MGKHHYPNRSKPLVPRTARKYIYDVALALMPLLGALGIISNEQIPLIITLLGAVLAVGVARTHLTPEEVESGLG